jgi:predicted TIM-barrel fold metal-dependent hydrolase
MFEKFNIIDTHMHLGFDPLMAMNQAAINDDIEASGKHLIAYLDKYGIEKCMAMPGGDPSFPKDWDDSEKNEILSKAIEPYRERIIGCGFLQPHLGKVYGTNFILDLMEKFYHEYGLRGFKLFCHRGYFYASDTELLEPVMVKAGELNTPIVIHSTRIPREMPSLIAHTAKAFPKTKIVIAHGGGHDFVHETIIALNETSNLYIDTSLLWEIDIKRIVTRCGAQKVMYGSDGPFLSPRVALVKIDECEFSKDELELILHKNAQEIWGF